jgi:hypothetical protein
MYDFMGKVLDFERIKKSLLFWLIVSWHIKQTSLAKCHEIVLSPCIPPFVFHDVNELFLDKKRNGVVVSFQP